MARVGGGGSLGIQVRKLLMSTYSRSHPASITQCMVHRGFAQERPEDSSSSNWGVGEPPIDEKHTERGTAPGSKHSQQPQGNSSSSPELSTDAEGQKYTPNLSKQKSTRDFINTQREERLHGSEGSGPASHEVRPEDAESQHASQKKGATPADVAAG
ncbi:hypothetical protein CY35_02G187600 [Sphagnum magellanicum]|nr:hypothetical protein CY35_02G187600 [Sphagnum magellanicum]KAH9573075.1 hypothetical protein CY35_02G187600 [Sphagnum magellanicum]